MTLTETAPRPAEQSPPWGARRVLYASSIDLGLPGGPANNEREFLKALSRVAGDRLHAVVPRPSRRDAFPPCELTPLPPTLNPQRRLAVKHSPLGFIRHSQEQYRVLQQLLTSGDYGFAILRLNLLPIVMMRTVGDSGVPFAIKTLGDPLIRGPVDFGGVKGVVGKAVSAAQHPMVQRLVDRAVAVDAVTERLAQLAMDRYRLDAGKVRVIPNATDTERFRPMVPAEARAKLGLERFGRIAGYMGGHPSVRGARHLVELAPRLLQRWPDLGIVVVGDDPGMEAVKTRAQELGVAAACHFAGLVPYEEVASYLGAFDVGLALDQAERVSKIGNSSQKIRQYLSCGIPVVTPGGDTIPIEEAGLGNIVPADDLSSVGDAIEHWLSERERRGEALQSEIRAFAARELSVDRAVRDRIGFWQQRVEKQARRS